MKYLLFLLFFLSYLSIQAQNTTKTLHAKYIDSSIEIDGLFEDVWETAETGEDFIQYFPTDTARAKHQTTFKILYNETTLYVGIKAYVPNKNYVVSSLKRDFRGADNDNVTFVFDTFNDGTNAYFFGVTPYGVQREGLVSEGGLEFSSTWDVKWQAESTMYDDFYISEFAIPFNSLKFIEGSTHWRMRGYRFNLQTNEQSSWTRVPQNHDIASLAYMGKVVFEKPLRKSKMPLALIPYVNIATSKDYITNNSESKLKTGGDAKVSIGNSMNLDITAIPDFSNVEVDDIFTNLTRFEIFLPEKRQFFIDNNDVFANYGSTSDNIPFFSRRVGLARDANGNYIENKILGGIRLSGKLTPTWRLGFLNLQTDQDSENDISSYNNMMLAFHKKVFTRSNLGFFMVNKQTFQDNAFLLPENKYNRVIGIDYDLASPNNVWRGNFFVHKSFQPEDNKGNFSAQSNLIYDDRDWKFLAEATYVDEDYRADLGFVPRKDIFKTQQSVIRRLYPKEGLKSSQSFAFSALNYWRPNLDFTNTDQLYKLEWILNYKNKSVLEFQFANNYVYLTKAFDPTKTTGAILLPENTDYSFNQFTVSYESNPAKLFTFSTENSIGAFFNGESIAVSGQLKFRFQPKVNISLALNYDGIRLPDPYADADIWLATAKSEITFSKSLFWSTWVQYSNQRDNLGINSRLQWRFAPLSDLYIVYNDNYFTGLYAPKYRSLNLKLSYWINM
ncbi:DUF5916 domain-containing protein [Mariniflexile aquimaris]|uniref:DUF5916 domain-containing protein n=1 Tax=Mariniflexile aquimaris TaxID=881009 RepID=A0ABW3BTX6_9FLAO